MSPAGRRWLVGSLAGCGALLLLAVGSCAGFVVWLNAPGDVLEPARLIDPATTGYVEWTLRLEEPATEEFFRTLLQAIDELRRELPLPLPPAIKGPLFELQSRAGARKLRRMFPAVAAWTYAGGAGGAADVQLWSVSLAGADHQLRLMDWIFGRLLPLGRERESAVRYRGETIVAIPVEGRTEPAGFFVHRGDLFVVTDLEAARRAIDRLQQALPAAAPPPGIERWLERAPQRPLRGAIDNGAGHVERLWRRLDPGGDGIVGDEVWSSVRGLTVGGALEAGGSFDAEVDLHFDSPDAAARAAAPFTTAWARLVEGTPLAFSGLEAEGERLRVKLEISRVAERLRDGARRMLPPTRGTAGAATGEPQRPRSNPD